LIGAGSPAILAPCAEIRKEQLPQGETVMGKPCFALALLASVPVFAGDPPPGRDRQLGLNPALVALPDNSWLNLQPKGTAYARMYSGCCAGGGHVWYFGGAHRAYKGNDVQLYDPRANEWIQATEPEWPEVPFGELLRIAFRDRLIESLDHPVLRRLRGEI
jgi:hypothetical protein